MIDVEQEWFRMKFQLAVLTRRGEAFQDFFAEIMEAAFPGDFLRVRPYGNKGDQKCDGLLTSKGHIFQVYAPRETKEAVMLAKVTADFKGAQKHWPDTMKGWIFVHNDTEGLPPGVVKALDALVKAHPQLAIEPWPPSRLESVALALPHGALIRLFGRAPQRQDFDQLGFAAVAVVLAAVCGHAVASMDAIEPVSPDKLAANALSEGIAGYLTMGRQREHLVQQYIDRQPNPTLGEEIAAAFRSEYARLRRELLTPDQIFVSLQVFAGGATRGDIEHEAAVLAVLSYLFERCDIFEAPPPK